MADRKRRRTAEAVKSIRKVLHKGGISLTGLADVVKSLRGQNTDDCTMRAIQAANSQDFTAVRRIIRLPLVNGGTLDWELADPCKLLQLALARSPWLQEIFSQARRPTSDQPWRIVIGFDEFMPGCNVLLDSNCCKGPVKRASCVMCVFRFGCHFDLPIGVCTIRWIAASINSAIEQNNERQ